MSGIIIYLFIFGIGSSFHPKPGNLWFFTKINIWDWQVFCLEPGSSFMFGSNRPVQNDRTEEYSFLGFLSKSALTRVFTSQIEVFSVKPAFHFSFVINSFHHDLFSEGVPRGFFYFRKRQSCIFGRTTSDDNRGIPGRGLFFSEITSALYFGHHWGDF